MGFVFAGHNNSVPSVYHFTKASVSITQSAELNKTDTFDLRNIQTDISNSDYILKKQNSNTLNINNATPDFAGFKKFFLGRNSTLTFNTEFSSNPIKIRPQINPRAP